MTDKITAAQIIHDLLIRIPKEFPARCWRHNVIAACAGDRFVRSSMPGISDIVGIVNVGAAIDPAGVFLAIEVKSPRDRVSPVQLAWLAMINRHGGIGFIARDVDGALDELRRRIEMHPGKLHGT
jgi:hypothetical protein